MSVIKINYINTAAPDKPACYRDYEIIFDEFDRGLEDEIKKVRFPTSTIFEGEPDSYLAYFALQLINKEYARLEIDEGWEFELTAVTHSRNPDFISLSLVCISNGGSAYGFIPNNSLMLFGTLKKEELIRAIYEAEASNEYAGERAKEIANAFELKFGYSLLKPKV